MELRRVRIDPGVKRRSLELCSPRDCDNALDNCDTDCAGQVALSPKNGRELQPILLTPILSPILSASTADSSSNMLPKFGIASVCGRRRDMEDAVAIYPSFCRRSDHEAAAAGLHYFGVYDGHGCSHVRTLTKSNQTQIKYQNLLPLNMIARLFQVATKCKERLHEMVKEELLLDDVGEIRNSSNWWKCVMERSFTRMDKEVVAWNENVVDNMSITCRCELQTPECDAVGSTAVVAVVTPHTIVVANCGDSRAVLCRNGKAVPLSTDHKVSCRKYGGLDVSLLLSYPIPNNFGIYGL